MNFLHQRAITEKHLEAKDTRARVYHNLVVLFRLLWHHRILEPAPGFWDYICDDFPSKSTRPQELRDVTSHYVSARGAYHRRHEEEGPETFLARLVDQWRSRPAIGKDSAPHLYHPQAADVYSRQARESWNAVRRRDGVRLIHSKELNWPVMAVLPAATFKVPSSLSSSQLSSRLCPTWGSETKRSPSPGRAPPTRIDTRKLPRPNRPPTPSAKGERASRNQRNLLPAARRSYEPGRLTPPPPPSTCSPGVGQKKASDPVCKVGSTSKHTAPESDGLSPHSKRRRITEMLYRRSDEIRKGCKNLDGTLVRPQQSEGTKDMSSDGFNVAIPSTEPQSLEEMIALASTADSPSVTSGSGVALQPSLEVRGGPAGRLSEARISETHMLEARRTEAGKHQVPSAVVVVQEHPMILIDVPATLVELARRIEDLEKTGGEREDAGAIISTLSRKLTDIERTVEERAEVSATMAAAVSSLTCTISGLEKKLKEAFDAQATIAALTCRITDLEKVVGERSDLQARTIADLEKTIDAQAKILEEQGLAEMGEVIE
ncbi:uncharacterized protein DNG_00737 [Cephalotrichum gorgonifer]|uniref:Uncharacterized protein n=1 Tax=Cephalotrichum gorgonifer TaxID=2041049 RepID=A0AAE8MRK0_9PEZI|nr:uncharacterized protein DNG_00737 [Cephalotrichum gorgonifer]